MADEKRLLRRLDISLRDSFSKIKEEMDDLKGKLEFQLNSIKEARKEIEDSKKDFVGVDKINSIKIKIGDLREELKAVERLEKGLGELQKKAADKEHVSASVEELKDKIDALEKAGSLAVPDAKFERLVREMNNEFAEIRKSVGEIGDKGGSIVKGRFARLEQDTNKKVILLGNRLNLFMDEVKKFPTKQEINQLLREVNREFDEVKEQLDDVKILKNDFKTMRREKIGRNHFEQQVESLKKELESMRADIKKCRKSSKEEKKGFNPYLFANILIILAFVLLGASLAMFFTDYGQYMDYFIYAAIGSFVLGILMRIVLVVKG